jgi:SAM-dependent methyltransferase/precorrin-6B methylase 2
MEQAHQGRGAIQSDVDDKYQRITEKLPAIMEQLGGVGAIYFGFVRTPGSDGPTDLNPGRMIEMIFTSWISQIVHAVAKVSIADELSDGPATAVEIATHQSTDPDATFRLLRAAVSLDLVTYDGQSRFSGTPLLRTLRNTSGSLRGLAIAMASPGHWLPWGNYLEVLKTGEKQTVRALGEEIWDYFAKMPAEAGAFTQGMTGLTALVERAVVRVIDTQAVAVAADIGGAAGALVHAFMQINPNLRGIVLDLPNVAPDATAAGERLGLAHRFSAIGGDFFQSVPEADLYLLKFILHDYDDESGIRILENCRRAMRPGGRVAIVELFLHETAESELAARMDVNMMVMLNGRERTVAEYSALCVAAGLRVDKVTSTESPMIVIEAVSNDERESASERMALSPYPASFRGDPAEDQNYGRMLEMIFSYWITQIVHAVAHYSIPEVLAEGPATAEEVALRRSLDPHATFRLLRACVSLGMVTYDGRSRFAATPLLATLEDTPGSLRGLAIALAAPGVWIPWTHIVDAIRTGKSQTAPALGETFWEYYARVPAEADAFTQGLSGLTATVEREAIRVVDTRSIDLAVDVGGAAGALVLAFMKANRNLRGIVLDRPNIVPRAAAAAERLGLADRFSALAGDYLESVPEADLYLLKFVLHDHDDASCIRILDNCRRAMRPGGRISVIELFLAETAKAELASRWDLNMLVVLGGRERTVAEYAKLFAAAGLRLEKVTPTDSLMIAIEAVAQ